MGKRGKFSLLVSFVVVALTILMKYLAPYGETYLPEWIEKGNVLVQAIENYKMEHQNYPVKLPIDPKCQDIPGCRTVCYFRNIDKNGKEYFRITIAIHVREAVIYDSRKNLSQSDYKILNN